jgi:hypothetical protein
MHRPNLSIITQLMRGAIDRMQREGKVKFREQRIVKLQEVFPFRPEDVASVSYPDKLGGGNSIHFHLQNGRVFDGHGQPSDAGSSVK